MHGHFGPARTEAHHIDGIPRADFLGKLPFLLVWHAEGCSFMELLLDGFHHRGMAMSGHQGAEAEVMVHVFVAVEVMNPAGFSVLHKNGLVLLVPVITRHPDR